MSAIPDRGWETEWKALSAERLTRLRALGLTDLCDWMTDPPVQVVGRINPEGVGFKLRLRGGGSSLMIYPDLPDFTRPRPEPRWVGCFDYDVARYGGDGIYFSSELVEVVAAELLARWRSGAPTEAGP
jgi:hypothetical protein